MPIELISLPEVAMPMLDLLFPVHGQSVPTQHGYALYGALCRIVPALHDADDIGIFPIRGTSAGQGKLAITDRSVLRLRLPETRVAATLTLAGKGLEVDGCRIRLGVPHIAALVPAPALVSRLVIIKLARPPGAHDQPPAITPDAFLAAARRQLHSPGTIQHGDESSADTAAGLGLSTSVLAEIPLIQRGPRAGQPQRRVLKVKDQTFAGYALLITGLTAEESIRLQEQGLGGRRKMGCGLFGPWKGGGE